MHFTRAQNVSRSVALHISLASGPCHKTWQVWPLACRWTPTIFLSFSLYLAFNNVIFIYIYILCARNFRFSYNLFSERYFLLFLMFLIELMRLETPNYRIPSTMSISIDRVIQGRQLSDSRRDACTLIKSVTRTFAIHFAGALYPMLFLDCPYLSM